MRWPGEAGSPLGLGRAIYDFQEWEIHSGRVLDDGGSPWWSTVNGSLVSDLRDAAAGSDGPWRDYMTAAETRCGGLQALLWSAHQHSIDRGVAQAAQLLDDETAIERDFARLAVAVVAGAAARNRSTATDELGRYTRSRYPAVYPCRSRDLEALRDRSSPR